MDKKAKITFLALSIITLSTILGAYFLLGGIGGVGALSESSTVSNATVAVSIGFTFSGNLTNGILFGSVNPNTLNNNATGNYLADAGNTSYFIDMDVGNNANTDACVKVNAPLTSGANTIGNGNYTYDANSTIDGDNMNTGTGAIVLNNTYVLMDSDLSTAENQYIQLYLDVPAEQSAGTYNNTVSFKIVQTGTGC